MTRTITHSLVKVLRTVPDFSALDDRSLLSIVGASANLFWPEKSLVFEKGDPAEALYVVLSGRIRIFDVVDGREHDVVTVGPGGFFGEHSLLLDIVHSKSACATEPSELMVVPRDSFQALMSDNPDLAAHLMEQLERRRLAEAERGSQGS